MATMNSTTTTSISNTNTKEERALLRQAKREENQRIKTERRETRLQAKMMSRLTKAEAKAEPATGVLVAPPTTPTTVVAAVAPAVAVPAPVVLTTTTTTTTDTDTDTDNDDTTGATTTTATDKATLRRMRRIVLRECPETVCEPILSAMELEAGLKQVVRMKRRQVKDIRRTCRLLRQTSEALATEQADLERLMETLDRQTAKIDELVKAAFATTTTTATIIVQEPKERRRAERRAERRATDKKKKEEEEEPKERVRGVRKALRKEATPACVDCTVCMMANVAAAVSRRHRRRDCC